MSDSKWNQITDGKTPMERGRALRRAWVYRDPSAVSEMLGAINDRERYFATGLDAFFSSSVSNAELAVSFLSDFSSRAASERIQELYESDCDASLRWVTIQYLIQTGNVSIESLWRNDLSSTEKNELAKLAYSVSWILQASAMVQKLAADPALERGLGQFLVSHPRAPINRSFSWLEWIIEDFAELTWDQKKSDEGRKLLEEYWTLVDRMLDMGLNVPLSGGYLIDGSAPSKRYKQFLDAYWHQKGWVGWFQRYILRHEK